MSAKESGNPIRSGLCSPETPSRIKVLGSSPSTAEAGEVANADRASEKRGATSVPELWYELASGVGANVTMSAHFCESLRVHCEKSNSRGHEVGGMVVGHQWKTSNGAGMLHSVLATDVIAVQPLDSSRSHLSFGELEWRDAEQELARRHGPQGKVKVGWYHTHPQQGIFFSDQDEAAHRMFKLAYHFALVVDPRFMEAGLFYWSGGDRRALEGPIRFVLGRGRK